MEQKYLTDKQSKEWRNTGKENYRQTISTQHRTILSLDENYDIKKKEERMSEEQDFTTITDYYFPESYIERLKNKWQYTDEMIQEAKEEWIKGYKASREWYKRADKKYKSIIDKYAPIFREASEIAESVDVSDIQDGFPCGSAHLYLQKYAEVEDLYKALGHFNGSKNSEYYKYELPIKFPVYGQCIAFDERICKEVSEFLRSKGIFAHTHTWID